MNKILTFLAAVFLVVGPAAAQQRPLVTEDPETIGSGLVLIEGGFDYQRSVFYPVSGLEGHLLRVPTLGLSLGVGANAEIQIDGGLVDRLTVTSRVAAPLASDLDFSGERTSDIQDLTVGTKLRVVPEAPGRPALALRFATKLPNAGNESGLGLDTMDFYLHLLIGKTVRSVRIVGNAGVGILGQPTRGDRQTDALLYGLSLARAVAQGVEIVGEVNGRYDTSETFPPPGTENRSAIRSGARITRGTVRVDGGVILGLTTRDTSVGFTAGLTWVFRGK